MGTVRLAHSAPKMATRRWRRSSPGIQRCGGCSSMVRVKPTSGRARPARSMVWRMCADSVGLGAEEFAAGGQVVEDGADFDLRAGGEADFVDFAELAAVDDELGAGEGVVLAGAQAELGDGGDAREWLRRESRRRRCGRGRRCRGACWWRGARGRGGRRPCSCRSRCR